MRILNVVMFCSFLISCKSTQHFAKVPGEWEKQEAIFLTYTDDPNDSLTTKGVMDITNKFIEHVSKNTKIYLLINDNHNQDSLIQFFGRKNYNTSNIENYKLPAISQLGRYLILKNAFNEKKVDSSVWFQKYGPFMFEIEITISGIR